MTPVLQFFFFPQPNMFMKSGSDRFLFLSVYIRWLKTATRPRCLPPTFPSSSAPTSSGPRTRRSPSPLSHKSTPSLPPYSTTTTTSSHVRLPWCKSRWHPKGRHHRQLDEVGGQILLWWGQRSNLALIRSEVKSCSNDLQAFRYYFLYAKCKLRCAVFLTAWGRSWTHCITSGVYWFKPKQLSKTAAHYHHRHLIHHRQ